MGNRWEGLVGDEPLLVPPAGPARRPRLFVPVSWAKGWFDRFEGVLFAGEIRLARRTSYRKRAAALPRWAARLAIAALRRVTVHSLAKP